LINIHEVDLAMEHADRIVGLHDGELVFEGTPAELDEHGLDQVYRGVDLPDSDRSPAQGASDDESGVLETPERHAPGGT